jgi:cell division protease FtsH
MDVKRYFRGPFFWVALVIIGVLLVTSISSAAGGFKKVDTNVAIQAIEQGKVEKAKIVDRDQRLELNLRAPGIQGSTKIQTDYVGARQREIINLLNDANPPVDYTDSVPRTSWVVSLLINFLPILILAFLILFFFNQMQGGGSRVMQFGKSKAKLISKDTPKTTF